MSPSQEPEHPESPVDMEDLKKRMKDAGIPETASPRVPQTVSAPQSLQITVCSPRLTLFMRHQEWSPPSLAKLTPRSRNFSLRRSVFRS